MTWYKQNVVVMQQLCYSRYFDSVPILWGENKFIILVSQLFSSVTSEILKFIHTEVWVPTQLRLHSLKYHSHLQENTVAMCR
jgi:hypothetical protein